MNYHEHSFSRFALCVYRQSHTSFLRVEGIEAIEIERLKGSTAQRFAVDRQKTRGLIGQDYSRRDQWC
jgi:hypothetical protein